MNHIVKVTSVLAVLFLQSVTAAENPTVAEDPRIQCPIESVKPVLQKWVAYCDEISEVLNQAINPMQALQTGVENNTPRPLTEQEYQTLESLLDLQHMVNKLTIEGLEFAAYPAFHVEYEYYQPSGRHCYYLTSGGPPKYRPDMGFFLAYEAALSIPVVVRNTRGNPLTVNQDFGTTFYQDFIFSEGYRFATKVSILPERFRDSPLYRPDTPKLFGAKLKLINTKLSAFSSTLSKLPLGLTDLFWDTFNNAQPLRMYNLAALPSIPSFAIVQNDGVTSMKCPIDLVKPAYNEWLRSCGRLTELAEKRICPLIALQKSEVNQESCPLTNADSETLLAWQEIRDMVYSMVLDGLEIVTYPAFHLKTEITGTFRNNFTLVEYNDPSWQIAYYCANTLEVLSERFRKLPLKDTPDSFPRLLPQNNYSYKGKYYYQHKEPYAFSRKIEVLKIKILFCILSGLNMKDMSFLWKWDISYFDKLKPIFKKDPYEYTVEEVYHVTNLRSNIAILLEDALKPKPPTNPETSTGTAQMDLVSNLYQLFVLEETLSSSFVQLFERTQPMRTYNLFAQ